MCDTVDVFMSKCDLCCAARVFFCTCVVKYVLLRVWGSSVSRVFYASPMLLRRICVLSVSLCNMVSFE